MRSLKIILSKDELVQGKDGKWYHKEIKREITYKNGKTRELKPKREV